MKFIQKICSLLLTGALALPLAAQAGDHSKKLSFDTTSTGVELDQDVSSLPVLVRLHSGNFTFSEAKPDGSDLRFFAADDKTPLKFHIERYDAANELAMVWVKMPKLKANAKTDALMLHWGGDAAAGTGADGKSTYDESQLLVLNFSDAEGVKDATGNALNAASSTAAPVAAGAIGGAVAFDGNARIVVPAAPALTLKAGTGWTLTAWVKSAAADKAQLLQLGTLSLELAAGGTPLLRSGSATAQAIAKLNPGTWQHLTVVFAGGKAQFFIDGNAAGVAALDMADASGELVIGSGLRGELDALTLASVPRTSAWVKAFAGAQAADSLLSDFGSGGEEGGEVSYFRILIGAVTLDGWIVIGVLGIMALVSAWVMVSKALMLSRTEKANAAFLDHFRAHATRLLHPDNQEVRALKEMKAVHTAPLFKLYEQGLLEIEHRFKEHARHGREQTLSATALESIRASLDAFIVRTNQRLNSGIVLLTIAISGGPFLGLLGTVVGVMITFAAIAAAGDVNVNAIAPGIAAALVATVAGLAVAIPALFGYNWLASKIKNISADIHVFADEFLTRTAEVNAD